MTRAAPTSQPALRVGELSALPCDGPNAGVPRALAGFERSAREAGGRWTP